MHSFFIHARVLANSGADGGSGKTYLVSLVLEYIPGAPLSSFYPEDFNSAQISSIVHGIATGIKEMHDAKLVHRDIKEENIFATRISVGAGGKTEAVRNHINDHYTEARVVKSTNGETLWNEGDI